MFAWPRFAPHLCGVRSPEKRVASLLADLAEHMPTSSAHDVLSTLFEDGVPVDAVERLAPHMHHVGFVAPPEIEAATIEEVLRASPFRNQVRTFKSAVLAQELSSRFGRNVDVVIVQGSVAAHPARSPAVEIFVADLPAEELERLVARETGCHVALALDPSSSFDCVRGVLHAHGCWENPLMRDGPLVNQEISSSVLYVDVPRRECTRRLEFIRFNAA
jgi:hypothetical protein